MRHRATILLWVGLTAWAADMRPAERLYQQALLKEKVERKLDEAVTLYQQIAALENEPFLAARALLHLGGCYERLGRAQARESDLRVLRRYPDQLDAVREARSRLVRLDQAVHTQPAGFTVRKLWTVHAWDALMLHSRPTQDGSLVVVRGSTFWLRNLYTGAERELWTHRHSGDVPSAGLLLPTLSSDGKSLAYECYLRGGGAQLWIVDLRTKSARPMHQTAGYYTSFWWSAGNTQIAVAMVDPRSGAQAAAFSVADGTINTVARPIISDSEVRFSPDEKLVAYSVPRSDSGSDVRIRGRKGVEILITDHPSWNRFLTWTLGGEGLLFSSDRNGSDGIWFQSLRDGQPDGAPVLLRAEQLAPRRASVTRQGTLVYQLPARTSDIYYVKTEPGTGAAARESPKTLIQSFSGANFAPSWSGSGQLAWASMRSQTARLMIRSAASDSERDIPAKLVLPHRPFRGSPAWSPDERRLLVCGSAPAGLYDIEVATAAARIVKPEYEGTKYSHPCWSADGNHIYTIRMLEFGTRFRVERISRATGDEAVLFESPRMLHGLSCSHDGRTLVFAQSGHGLKALSTSGDQTPFDLSSYGGISATAFSPDDRYVYFASGGSVQRVPTRGGPVESIGLRVEGTIEDLAFHSDGSRMAFSRRTSKVDFWAMENWLPKPTRSDSMP